MFSDVLSYWFGGEDSWSDEYHLNTQLWFRGDKKVDEDIRTRFEPLLQQAVNGELDAWQETPEGSLALILLYDQFSRNMYRGTAQMFAFDRYALPIAHRLVNEQLHMRLSPPQRLFVYYVLEHSENEQDVQRSVELFNVLQAQAGPNLAPRFAAQARVAQQHLDILKKFGRYPHRNALVGRDSTSEEKEFLSKTRHRFMLSVQERKEEASNQSAVPSKRGARSRSRAERKNQEQQQPKSKPKPQKARRLRILVFHSFRQNSYVFRRKTGKLRQKLEDVAELIYVNAPHAYFPVGENKKVIQEAFGKLPDLEHQRCWWVADDSHSVYHGVDITLRYIDHLFETQGPFDGIFSFGQGCALAGVLAAMQPFGSIRFDFGIFVSGFISRADVHQALMTPQTVRMPTLHLIGRQDILVDEARSRALADVFINHEFVAHEWGHFVPDRWPLDLIRDFIVKQFRASCVKHGYTIPPAFRLPGDTEQESKEDSQEESKEEPAAVPFKAYVETETHTRLDEEDLDIADDVPLPATLCPASRQTISHSGPAGASWSQLLSIHSYQHLDTQFIQMCEPRQLIELFNKYRDLAGTFVSTLLNGVDAEMLGKRVEDAVKLGLYLKRIAHLKEKEEQKRVASVSFQQSRDEYLVKRARAKEPQTSEANSVEWFCRYWLEVYVRYPHEAWQTFAELPHIGGSFKDWVHIAVLAHIRKQALLNQYKNVEIPEETQLVINSLTHLHENILNSFTAQLRIDADLIRFVPDQVMEKPAQPQEVKEAKESQQGEEDKEEKEEQHKSSYKNQHPLYQAFTAAQSGAVPVFGSAPVLPDTATFDPTKTTVADASPTPLSAALAIFPSQCAWSAPRLLSMPDKLCRIAKEVAGRLFPVQGYLDKIVSMEKQRKNLSDDAYAPDTKAYQAALNYAKRLSYSSYTRLLSYLSRVLFQATPEFSELINAEQRRRLNEARSSAEAFERASEMPLADAVINPEPEPVHVCSLDELDPLLKYLKTHEPVNTPSNMAAFTKGTLVSDGRLDLCKQVVGSQGIGPLLDSMRGNPHIKRLLLGNNIVGDYGAKLIADFIAADRLRQQELAVQEAEQKQKMELNARPESERAGEAIEKISHLDCWYIAGNDFSADGMEHIANALQDDTQVTSLWLKRNPLKPAGMVPMARLLRLNHTIQVLDLVNTGILDEGLNTLFSAFDHNTTLQHLYLSTNGLTAASAPRIREHFLSGKNKLLTLFLAGNRLADEGTAIIAEGLKEDRVLQRLGLASNRIGPKGAKALADALAHQPTLQYLDLGFIKATIATGELGNRLVDEGAGHIARMLKTNTALISIDLTHNSIGQVGVNHLHEALKTNTTLVSLKLTQFGKVHNEVVRESINSLINRNLALLDDEGRKYAEKVDLPDHVAEIYSVYRTKF